MLVIHGRLTSSSFLRSVSVLAFDKLIRCSLVHNHVLHFWVVLFFALYISVVFLKKNDVTIYENIFHLVAVIKRILHSSSSSTILLIS